MCKEIEWIIKKQDENLIKNLAAELNITEVCAQILLNRGLKNKTACEEFLLPSPNFELDNKEVKISIDRIRKAINNNERILIYGDYDVDGICGVVILLKVLKKLGAKVAYHIPSRNIDGYGLNKKAIEKAYNKGFSLIITVDCGIQDIEEVKLAKNLGIDVIITDHHLPSEELPIAYSIINPKLYNNEFICDVSGAGVVFMLANELEGNGNNYIDLVALGTTADIVPLINLNRYLVKQGLQNFKNTQIKGLKALIDVSGLKNKEINAEYHIPFILAPRINAAGRITTAAYAVELLLTEDEEKAKRIAAILDKKNRERQEIQDKILTEAQQIIDKEIDLSKYKILVLANYNWPISIVGIVASKLVEIYNRPAIIISLEKEEQTARGSCRSIEKFNIFDALAQCKNLLLKFGGHKYAAGIEIEVKKINAFREEINKIACDKLTDEMLLPQLIIDKEIKFNEITPKLYNELDKLPPYGIGNPRPVFLTHDVLVKEKLVFEDRIKLVLVNNGINYDATYYNTKKDISDNLSIVYQLDKMNLGDYELPYLKIKDVKI